MNLFAQIDAYPNMRSKKKQTEIGPTCTQGGHNPLPPSGTCPQSNETFIFPGLLYQLLIKSELIKYDEKLIFVLCFVN
jgi:hypothetical protein